MNILQWDKTNSGVLTAITTRLIAVAMMLASWLEFADAATSVSQFEFTWKFSQDRTVGQFANGDWWVVGPVTITSITPADTNPNDGIDMHGTMVNPVHAAPNVKCIQGWDNRIIYNNYDPSLNIARSIPYVVANGSSIMSCASQVATATGNLPQMETIGILTVLASAPPVGSFRPPYIGTDKSIKWNMNQLDYTKLKNLTPVGTPPTFVEAEGQYEHTHISLEDNWNGNYLLPINHDYPNYGREISHKIGRAALLLNLNYTNSQKETLLIRIVQRGIDICGISNVGGGWQGNGGHLGGRKLPMMIAGHVLNDPTILARSNNYFAEDRQHFYVTQFDVDLPRHIADPTRQQDPYTTAMIGTPEWCSDHTTYPADAGSNWNVYYRTVVGPANVGQALAARIMGLQTAWNWPSFFDYMDRFWTIEGIQNKNISTATNSIHPFVAAMWNAYRGDSTVVQPPPPISVNFAIGDRISTSKITNVRDAGKLAGGLLDTQAVGALGTLVAGPIVSDSITWWQVNYDLGVDGWSGQDNFIKLSPPSTPTGLKEVK